VAAARFLHGVLDDAHQKVMGALLLDCRTRAVGYHIAYRGTLSRAAAEPRGLLVPALLANASGIIVFHNHPSGDPSPSSEDVAFTARLASAGEVVGVELLDHLIIGERPSYVSLKERCPSPWHPGK
jgi:DNA repair protein RadC